MTKLLEERPRDYPSECPIDGLLLTHKPYGIVEDNGPRLGVVHAVTVHSNSDSPAIRDHGVVFQKLLAMVPPQLKASSGIEFREEPA
jgi:hypothetical protein